MFSHLVKHAKSYDFLKTIVGRVPATMAELITQARPSWELKITSMAARTITKALTTETNLEMSKATPVKGETEGVRLLIANL